MIIRILLSFVAFVASVQSWFAALKDDIIPTQNPSVIDPSSAWGTWLLDAVLLYIKDSIFALMALIAIAVFLYIGWRLILARWNPEEHKKAWMTFIYAVVGIFIVAFAWAAVRLIAGLNF